MFLKKYTALALLLSCNNFLQGMQQKKELPKNENFQECAKCKKFEENYQRSLELYSKLLESKLDADKKIEKWKNKFLELQTVSNTQNDTIKEMREKVDGMDAVVNVFNNNNIVTGKIEKISSKEYEEKIKNIEKGYEEKIKDTEKRYEQQINAEKKIYKQLSQDYDSLKNNIEFYKANYDKYYDLEKKYHSLEELYNKCTLDENMYKKKIFELTEANALQVKKINEKEEELNRFRKHKKDDQITTNQLKTLTKENKEFQDKILLLEKQAQAINNLLKIKTKKVLQKFTSNASSYIAKDNVDAKHIKRIFEQMFVNQKNMEQYKKLFGSLEETSKPGVIGDAIGILDNGNE